MRRVASGVTGFDELIAGGYPAGSVIALRGAPGTGKTTFGLQFLVGGALASREPGLFVTFEELPEQLYAEGDEMGWDLRSLERQGLLTILTTSPDVFLDQLQSPDSMLETMAKRARRVVIDSATLFTQLVTPDTLRDRLYRLRSVLKRIGVTAILIEERHAADSGETLAFLADGVITLAFEAKADGHRAREIEILKLRGSPIISGRHLFRIGPGGIHVYPALTTHDILELGGAVVCTGIPNLDELLGGGITPGATVLLDANSRAEYRLMVFSLLMPFLARGDGLMLTVGTSVFPAEQQERLSERGGVDMARLVAEQRLLVFDHPGVDVPAWAESALVTLDGLCDAEHHAQLRQALSSCRSGSREGRNENWIWFQDLNAVTAARGEDYLARYFIEQSGLCHDLGITTIAMVNSAEIRPSVLARLQRGSTVALKTWVDGRYQYFEVEKSPTGRVSEPLLVQYGQQAPFVELR